jgi:hypothetical protein
LAEIALKQQPVAVPPKSQNRKPRSGGQSGGQGRTIVTAAAGTLFVSYVFNFQGFQDSADGYFRGLDAAARAQSPIVAHFYLALLPYAGVALVAGFLWILTKTLLRMIAGAVMPKKKKKTPEVAAEHPLPEMFAPRLAHPGVKVAAAGQAAQKPAAVCVKPRRLDVRDVGVAKVILPRR